jgi:hypothetical protein
VMDVGCQQFEEGRFLRGGAFVVSTEQLGVELCDAFSFRQWCERVGCSGSQSLKGSVGQGVAAARVQQR